MSTFCSDLSEIQIIRQTLSFPCSIEFRCFQAFWTYKKVNLAENEKTAENGQNGAQGLDYKIIISFEVIFGFYDKNYPRK